MGDRESRGKDIKYKKNINRLNILFILSLMVLIIGTLFLVIGAEKRGIGWNEVNEKENLQSIGRIGGDELLIKEELEGEVSVETFKEMKSKGESFYVYFYSPYCKYCDKSTEGIFEKLKENKVKYVVVNINDKKEFQEKEDVKVAPVLAYYKDGEKVSTIEGYREVSEYDEFIKANEKDKKQVKENNG